MQRYPKDSIWALRLVTVSYGDGGLVHGHYTRRAYTSQYPTNYVRQGRHFSTLECTHGVVEIAESHFDSDIRLVTCLRCLTVLMRKDWLT
jgi:hypothetical protein